MTITTRTPLTEAIDDHPARACIEYLLIASGLGAMFFIPHPTWGDGTIRYEQLNALMAYGKLTDTQYSFVGPILSAPLWLIGRALGHEEWWTLHYNAVLLMAGIAFCHFALRGKVPPRLSRTFLLLLVFGSMFAAHQVRYYGEVFTAVLVLVGSVSIVVSRARAGAAAGWAAIAVGVANTPGTVFAMVLLTGRRIWSGRRLRVGLALVLVTALVLGENWIRRGNPFDLGYDDATNRSPRTLMPYSGRPGFSYPIFFGLLSLTLSFGKGLLFFAPGMFLPVRQRLRDLPDACGRLYAMWMTFTVGLLLTYAMYWSWHGAWFYGPRYLLFASVPAAFALAVRLYRPGPATLADLITLAALAMSLWACLIGVAIGDVDVQQQCYLGNTTYNFAEPICSYTPEFSALWYHVIKPPPLATWQVVYLWYGGAVASYLMWPPVARLVRAALPHLAGAFSRAKTVRW
ncbi:hypothetical protein J4573_53085 [Actinomadura barringtoniae]|uniref:Uncharacterized protein n=1 Tax=Actinomadura barringtoniae TaxID=1427535 RepID=A0A939PTD6_9ACTN|nr:hypothetical protein [Actinomadura barringtoniae]MBO2455894.1 hypothetical protein [Actinomadura barringtoniae]